MTLLIDRILLFMDFDSWIFAKIFAYAVAYSLYLTLPAFALIAVAIRTD